MDRRHAPPRAATLAAGLAAALGACRQSPPPPEANPGNFARAQNGWFRGDLHFHTNFSGDARQQGGDDLAAALAIADAYRDPAYLAANPGFAGDGLDFVALTDHRTDEGIRSPDFRHDHLVLLPGEEYGGAGHAGIWGLARHIPHEPQHGEPQDERHRDAVREAHAQGALFSVNHPCQSTRWPWIVDEVDGVEVWNAQWSAFWGESAPADLDGGEAENPFIRGAVSASGGGSNHQALVLWYGMLSRGRHAAPVGGGDRHMLVMPGYPTTYVRAAAGADAAAILRGIRERHVFVSSDPHGPQVELTAVDAAGRVRAAGDELAAGATHALSARVTRAQGGVVRFVGGPMLPGDGAATAQPQVLSELAIASADETLRYGWTAPAGGGWVHAIVLVPRLDDPVAPEVEKLRPHFDVLPQGKDLSALLPAFAAIVDGDTLLDPARCDPSLWEPFLGQCVPADRVALETYYLPGPLLRLANTWFEAGAPTAWSMGALTSAFLARP